MGFRGVCWPAGHGLQPHSSCRAKVISACVTREAAGYAASVEAARARRDLPFALRSMRREAAHAARDVLVPRACPVLLVACAGALRRVPACHSRPARAAPLPLTPAPLHRRAHHCGMAASSSSCPCRLCITPAARIAPLSTPPG
eukprot:3055149-Pleurochrysis_carterae.AAC.1